MTVIYNVEKATIAITRETVRSVLGIGQAAVGYEKPSEFIPLNPQKPGPHIVFVNGILTDRGMAIQTGLELSSTSGRPVDVIYNQTQGPIVDLVESAIDKLGPGVPALSTLIERIDPTTRKIYETLRDAAANGQSLSLITHSEGNLQARNALALLNPVEQAWAKSHLAWVALAPPFNVHNDLALLPNTFTAIFNKNDGVTRIFGANGLTVENVLNLWRTPGDHRLPEYLKLVKADMLTPNANLAPAVHIVDVAPPTGLVAKVTSVLQHLASSASHMVTGAVKLAQTAGVNLASLAKSLAQTAQSKLLNAAKTTVLKNLAVHKVASAVKAAQSVGSRLVSVAKSVVQSGESKLLNLAKSATSIVKNATSLVTHPVRTFHTVVSAATSLASLAKGASAVRTAVAAINPVSLIANFALSKVLQSKPVARIVAKVAQPILKVAAPVLKVAAPILKPVAKVAQFVQKAATNVVHNIGKAIGKLFHHKKK